LLGSLPVSPELIERVVAIYEYAGPAKQAVQRLKYEGESALIEWMSAQMGLQVQKQGWQDQVFVPVPIHRSRRSERAFNQAEALCEAIPGSVEPLLERTRKTVPQAALNKALRSENIRGAFAANGEVLGREIVIVDDVCTTGSTVSECAKVLLRAGAKSVRVLAFAGVP
jgi:ComF family protein